MPARTDHMLSDMRAPEADLRFGHISFASLASQLDLEAIGVFEVHGYFVAVEGQRPGLGLAVAQNPALHHKRAFAGPASPRRIDAIGSRSTPAIKAIQPHQPCKPGGPLVPVGRDYP